MSVKIFDHMGVEPYTHPNFTSEQHTDCRYSAQNIFLASWMEVARFLLEKFHSIFYGNRAVSSKNCLK